MLTKNRQTPTKLLEKYDFPKEIMNKEIWLIGNRNITFDFIEKKITISGNTINKIFDVSISFEEIETLHKILNKEEI